MKTDILHWLDKRMEIIHGCAINGDGLSALSHTERLYLYCEIVRDFHVHIPAALIRGDIFSSKSKIAEYIGEKSALSG